MFDEFGVIDVSLNKKSFFSLFLFPIGFNLTIITLFRDRPEIKLFSVNWADAENVPPCKWWRFIGKWGY